MMKKPLEKLNISDKTYVVNPMCSQSGLIQSESFQSVDNSKSFNEKLINFDKYHNTKRVQIANSGVLSDFDGGFSVVTPKHIGKQSIAVKTALNANKINSSSFSETIKVDDGSEFGSIIPETIELATSLSFEDGCDKSETKTKGFSISDSVSFYDKSYEITEIPLLQKDFLSVSSQDKLYYVVNDTIYAAVGEVKEGKFHWYLNYDFPTVQETNVVYSQQNFDSTNKNIFSSTQNISLIYAKSEFFTNSKRISVKLLPISLDGTPIEQVKIDLNQNFINPIQKKFNFNSLTTSGDKYMICNNTLKTYSLDSIVKGCITFDSSIFIKKISHYGRYSLPSPVGNILSKLDNLYVSNNNYSLRYKALPYEYDERNYYINDFRLDYTSLECRSLLWQIQGKGEWRNIIVTMDDERGVNKGNVVELTPISYRYDGNNGWKGTNLSNTFKEVVSGVYGQIEGEDGHIWGIGESDGSILYSIDKVNWVKTPRGLKGKTLYWKSDSEISYLVVWKNNNKEISYDKTGKLTLNVENFGGICFERDKELKVRIDNGEWETILNGDELNGKKFTTIEWEYAGNKLIFVKDLTESYDIESDDIENQGFHYGRISVYTKKDAQCCNNFYRFLGLNDAEITKITLNPLFSWVDNENNDKENQKYAVYFRKIGDNDFGYEVGGFSIEYDLGILGKKSYEKCFDINGKDLNGLGFLEYREYKSNRTIEVHNGEIVGIYLYDKNGNEFVLTYRATKTENGNIQINFLDNEKIKDEDWNGGRVIVLYYINKWSETHFRAELEEFDINTPITTKVELNTVKKPLKAFLYNRNDEELQLPIMINGNKIIISCDEYDELSKVVILVKGNLDSKGTMVQRFEELSNITDTYYNPVVSIFKDLFLPNKINSKNKIVEVVFPNAVKKTKNYIVMKENSGELKEKILSKVWFNTSRDFNTHKNNFKTYVSCSDDFRYWSNWKEFNEEFDLCEYGKFFKLKTVTFSIEKSDSVIDKIYFAFENLSVANRDSNGSVYFSPNYELEKNINYVIRVKSYNGVNYSEWSNTECYKTGNSELIESENTLSVDGESLRQIKEVKFIWDGQKNILKYNNTTIGNAESGITRSGDELFAGKEYFWKLKGINEKTVESSFAMNIKPPTPTFD